MRRVLIVLIALLSHQVVPALASSVRGDPEAIAEAEAMVETMGGKEIWSQLQSVHFVHEWWPKDRVDAYLENEILDLTGPRSWVEMKSEIYARTRAYSPEHGYWSVVNGVFSYADEKAFENAMERAPYSIYRIARALAIGDADYEVRLGPAEIMPGRRLEFYGRDGAMHGWIILNARKEPRAWGTTQYTYTFGPMKRFGNLRVPDWAITGNGATLYEMISLTGDNRPPDSDLFRVPEAFRDRERTE